MNIAVCDSEKIFCEDISRLILHEKPSAKIFIFTSKEDLLKSRVDFSIIFLDIGGVSGLEIAQIFRRRQEILNQPKNILIFITGHPEYMEKAFDVHAFHYLLKPIDTKKFSQVLLRAWNEAELLENQKKNYLLIKIGASKKKIFLQNIFFLESDNKKVIFHTEDGIFETYGKMDSFEILLSENFFRCHRCYLVNLAKISSYTSDSIILSNGEKIFLAGKKRSDFVKKFLKYAQSGGMLNI